jgi:hypothetical protein
MLLLTHSDETQRSPECQLLRFQKRDRGEEIVAANPKMPRHCRIRRIRMVGGVKAFFLGLNVGFDQRDGPVQVGNEDAQLQPAILARSEQSLGLVHLCLKMVRVVRIDRRTCIRRAARIIGRVRLAQTPWPLRAPGRWSSAPVAWQRPLQPLRLVPTAAKLEIDQVRLPGTTNEHHEARYLVPSHIARFAVRAHLGRGGISAACAIGRHS